MNDLTLSNGSGGLVPNFAAFGLKWTEAQKKAEKLDEIWRRQKDAGRAAGRPGPDTRPRRRDAQRPR